MDTLELIAGMDAAIRILKNTNRQLCSGSFTIWRLVEHAENYLDSQIKGLLAPAPESTEEYSAEDQATFADGAPTAAELQAEERTRIGNTPTYEWDQRRDSCTLT